MIGKLCFTRVAYRIRSEFKNLLYSKLPNGILNLL